MSSTQSEPAGATRAWPADRVERWPIERLIPYANNPRLHSEADLDKIAASIRKWGWTNAGPGRRARRADRRPCAGWCRGEAGAEIHPGDRRARVERRGEAGLSLGRQ